MMPLWLDDCLCKRRKSLRLIVRTARLWAWAKARTWSSGISWLARPVSWTVTTSWGRSSCYIKLLYKYDVIRRKRLQHQLLFKAVIRQKLQKQALLNNYDVIISSSSCYLKLPSDRKGCSRSCNLKLSSGRKGWSSSCYLRLSSGRKGSCSYLKAVNRQKKQHLLQFKAVIL